MDSDEPVLYNLLFFFSSPVLLNTGIIIIEHANLTTNYINWLPNLCVQ